jgi:predicted CxxxxCH...CXXCH cytochrome family protein
VHAVPLTPRPVLAGAAAALALSLSACGAGTSSATQPAALGECSVCHGGPESSAPPRATNGATATSDVRVGAHQAHVGAGPFRRPISCDECHPVPETVGARGHQDGTVDVVFSSLGLARARGAAPAWSRATATCASTYCHGATLSGGANPAPSWTAVDGTQVRCGSCHGAPPALAGTSPRVAHPAVSGPIPASCAPCHPGTVEPDGSIALGGGQHLDGVVQVGGTACASCHGDPARLPASLAPAPPRDTAGNTTTTARGVGAHQKHLTGTTLRASPIDCAECHEPRDTMSRHPSGTVDVVFGRLARAGGAVPAWNRAASTCTSYCHGATLRGGTRTAPVWTQVDGTQVTCTSCHGIPPPAPHVQDLTCGRCHLGFTSTTVARGLHLDGYVEVDLRTCVSCHGDPSRTPELQPAPPRDLGGDTSTSALGVGAHQAHLTGTSLARPMDCSACHPPITRTDHAQGMNLVRQIAFGPLATAGGTHPVWDRTALTCASTYCHGATLGGGTHTAPVWTRVDGSQKRCGTCHGVPPPAPHPARPDCGSCHAGYTSTTVVPATHVDGVVNADSARCTSCHGDASRIPATAAAAPPNDLGGRFATTARGVGAHQRHLVAGTLSPPIACTECHVVPTVMGHANGAVEVTFGPLAVTSAAPVWNGARCSNVYCHGASLRGGTLKAPLWTTVDGTQATCGTCHGVPPPAPHPQTADCGSCHAGYTAASVDLSKHVDGVVQATGSCTACHGDASATGTGALASAPPRDTLGNTVTSALGVGAHRAHVEGGPLRAGLACTECHPATNAASHPDGTLSVTFGPLARGAGAAPTWNRVTAGCSAVYCHGATLSGGTVATPVWTTVDGTAAACAACHGVPPPGPHPQDSQCSACHPGYTATSVDPATHVDGVVNATGAGSCTFCHGDEGRAGPSASAPPRDTRGNTLTTARGVGAHQRHLEGGPLRAGIGCTECHPTPGTSHPSGAVELAFGPLASTGTTPSWTGASLTCAATYCHGATLGGGTDRTPLWTAVDGTQAACGTCHGVPPPRPHVQRTACGTCHPGSSATTVDPAIHVDGLVQTANLTCTTCHGDAARVLVTGADARAQAAPPTDSAGGSATTLRSVGAHLAHVNHGTGAIAAPVACAECHVVPASTAHADGVVNVTFGVLARTGGVAPAWSGSTCSNTYCHGNHTNGLNGTPVWTSTAPLSCSGSCHAAKPGDATHTTFRHDNKNGACNGCHLGVDATGTRITSPALHVNGRVDGLCTDCHKNGVP